jgi:hypothetical protein
MVDKLTIFYMPCISKENTSKISIEEKEEIGMHACRNLCGFQKGLIMFSFSLLCLV